MTPDQLLTAALDVAYFGIFALTFLDYVRRPDPIRLAIAAIFGSIAAVLVVPVVGGWWPDLPPAASTVSVTVLLAQPILTLRLIHLVRPISRSVLVVAVGSFALSSAAFILVGTTERAVTLGVVAYFVGAELLAGALLALEARRRRGSSRRRLATAALGTGLFGLSILVAGAGSAAGPGDASSVATAAARLVALLAAMAYLVAFVPPHWLRNLDQQGVAFGFTRDLAHLPMETRPDRIWQLLATAARGVTGATTALVSLGAPGVGDVVAVEGPAPGSARDGTAAGATGRDGAAQNHRPALRQPDLVIPIVREQEPVGAIELSLRGRPLFVDDDLELLSLLGNRAARVAERATLIEELRGASAAKSDFLAAMSHELRTPLNAIIGFSELLLRPLPETGQRPETVREYAEHIHASGLHLLDVINDVLDLSRVEAGRLDLRPVRFDLRTVVAQTLETMRPLADRKAIVLECSAGGPAELEADPGRMRQVVFNLLSNAIKFTPDGGRVDVTLSRLGETIHLSVADTGPGIAPEDRARIFEAFGQLDGGDHGRQEGTGLGLALTRQLVEAHGGRLELESEVGKGSRFTVVLPVPAAPEAAPVELEARPEVEESAPVVLVIEDDPRAAGLLTVYLREAGYGVAVAVDGRTGIEEARRLRPAAIVLDILLPDIDGWAVLQQLKRRKATRDIPVLIVSVVDDAQLGLALGAVDYFVKPVSRDALLTALGRLTFTRKVHERTVTVLVIDPDPGSAPRYETLLGRGFRVLWAETAQQGLDIAAEGGPDIVLLDLILPDGDAFKVVAALKAGARTGDIPIWVATRGTLDADQRARLNGDVLGFVERGESALPAFQRWLERVATGGPGAS